MVKFTKVISSLIGMGIPAAVAWWLYPHWMSYVCGGVGFLNAYLLIKALSGNTNEAPTT